MKFTFLVIVFVLSVGFAKMMAMWVNWICAQPIAKRIAFADKTLNLCLIIAYPLTLIYGLGWYGPRFLSGGNTWAMAPIWWWLIALGLVGLVALIAATIRHQRYRPPACELAVVSNVIDCRQVRGKSWRQSLVGPRGRMRYVALLPSNEQFSIDVSTKTYALPRLPADWDGLSIVHISDLHFYNSVARPYFEMVCEQAVALQPDLFVFSGDLLDDDQRIEWLPETLGRLRAPLGQFFVLGNHDWYLNPGSSRREMVRLGWTDLTERTVSLQRPEDSQAKSIILCGDETPWMGTHPDLSNIPSDAFRILVSHTPDNIGWARNNQIDLMLCGHTHGGQVRLPILGPIYSPSNYGCRFASGVFWLDPTLMYVSRGVSGKEPIRYNCRPEVTKLILNTAGFR